MLKDWSYGEEFGTSNIGRFKDGAAQAYDDNIGWYSSKHIADCIASQGQWINFTQKETEKLLERLDKEAAERHITEGWDKQLELALSIATENHQGQKDKGGHDYIEHPKAVASACETDAMKCAALLHDTIEDGHETSATLLAKGMKEIVVKAVSALTRKSTEDYKSYVRRLGENPLTAKVKMADLKHNMDLTRIPNPTKVDLSRIKKYKKALAYLESCVWD